MYCKFCGSSIDGDCLVCPYCGKRLVENSQNDKIENEFDNFYDNKQEFRNQNNFQNNNNNNFQNQNMAQNSTTEKPADSIFLLIGLFLVSFFMQPLGIIFAIIWKDEYPKRAKVSLAAFLIPIVLVILSIIAVLITIVAFSKFA